MDVFATVQWPARGVLRHRQRRWNFRLPDSHLVTRALKMSTILIYRRRLTFNGSTAPSGERSPSTTQPNPISRFEAFGRAL